MYHIYSFEKLDVYTLARKFKIDIKLMSRLFPNEERFDLTSQINRSSASISANIAEVQVGHLTSIKPILLIFRMLQL